jgi:hypothetical protein
MNAEEREFRAKELVLRERELRHQRIGVVVASAATFLSLVIAIAAVVASVAAYQAAKTASTAVDKSAREQRISTGIGAMGADAPAQRIAGIGLLGRSVGAEVDRVSDDDPTDALGDEQRDARAAYLATVDALENYIGAWESVAAPTGGSEAPDPTSSSATPTTKGTATAAAGDPAARSDPPFVPKDVLYAFNELLRLVDVERRDAARSIDAVPGVDLTGAHLPGVYAEGMDVSWLSFYAPGLDLRAAKLRETTWGTADLRFAHLACARLYGAHFDDPADGDTGGAGADLTGADLRGANLMDSDLRGVHLDGADLRAADLRNADLRGADVTGARLRGADTAGAHWDGAVGFDLAAGLDRPPIADKLWDRADCLDKLPRERLQARGH